LLRLAGAVSTLLVVMVVHSADAAVPPALQPTAPQAITPLPDASCHLDWQVVPSPNAGSQHNYLTAIDALSPNDVWAVGYYTGTGRYHPLTQHWDGHAWSIIPNPNTGYHSFLSAVEAIAPNDVWAVGSFYNDATSSVRHLLTMHWNGSQWSVVPNPDPGGNYTNFLNGVAAVASNDVWAVGFWRQNSPQGLILHWNGSQWHQVANPTTGSVDSMNGVAVVSETDVWAVGSTSPNDSLIWRWNGAFWTSVPSPNVGPLIAVDAVSQYDAWAIGYSSVLRWDGSQWNTFAAPGIGPLYGVAAIASNDVWVVGTGLAHWDGTRWTTVPNPSTGTLRGVSALSSLNVWAAGNYSDAGIEKTLIERYSYHCESKTCFTIEDSISNSDPVQPGMLNRSLTPSPCNLDGMPCPGIADTTPRHYKAYNYMFPYSSFSAQCITVQIDAPDCAGNLHSAAYGRLYDPNSICPADLGGELGGWLGLRGALGDFSSGSGSYQFTATRGNPFSIVVHEVTPNSGCSDYSITVATDVWCDLIVPITATPTPTNTPSLPTATRTPTVATQTPLPTATACTVVDYTYAVTPISPDGLAGTTETAINLLDGSQCTGCTVPASLPFPFAYYGQTYENIIINTRGHIQFTSSSDLEHTCPLPVLELGPAMLPYWSLFSVRWGGSQPDPCMANYGIPCGIYTSTTGKPPDRVFNVHWVGVFIGSNHSTVNFEARLHETTGVFDFVYHTGIQFGDYASIGIQDGASRFTSYTCNTYTQLQNIQVRWTPVLVPCPSATPAPTLTRTPIATGTATNTPRPPTQTPGGPTATPIPTGTIAPTASATAICALQMADVLPGSTFYPHVRCLTCKGIIGGYPCGGQGEPCNPVNDPYFRPNNGITRGQIAKIVSEAAGFTEDAGPQAYEDVPAGSPFYANINRLSNRGLIGGYPCGQMPGEPCVGPGNRPYFRPNTGATRGQLAKIVGTAAGINDPVTGQFYADVQATNPFYVWIERLTSRAVMGGYPCGSSPGEPCDAGNRPYFRWAADITRGQSSKIVTNTFFPGCQVSSKK
ncbi:MAG TPA: S-layer homology domain-containing protein, partial [Chloroflexia bacterium]|nr:S-layer homology domain-containing protein [Chloroflexia bacterium]